MSGEVQRTQFTFYESFFRAIRRIRNAADRAAAYDVLCAYALYGEEPDLESLPDAVAIAFEVAKPNLDASRRKATSGKHGGEANKSKQAESKPEANGSKPEANGKQTAEPRKQEKEQEKEQEQVQDKEQMLSPCKAPLAPKKKAKPERHKYGSYRNVLLTDEELVKLQEEFPVDWAERVERLSGYIAQSGKTYKSHLATIRNWARQDRASPASPAPSGMRRGEGNIFREMLEEGYREP